MKIAFWSTGDYSTGVTSNLACLSVASTFEYSHKSVIIESHQQKNKLENMLRYNVTYRRNEIKSKLNNMGMGHILNYYLMNEYNEKNKSHEINKNIINKSEISKNIMKEEGVEYKGNNSNTTAIKKINRSMELEELEPQKKSIIEESSIEILYEKLFYLPTDYLINRHMYEYKLYQYIGELLKELDSFADVTYIDTQYQNLNSKIIIDEADVIVVNFTDNIYMIENFFSNYKSIIPKCVFIINQFNSFSSINIKEISKKYIINPSKIVSIPKNMDYYIALQEGTIVEFLSRNYFCTNQNINYSFIKQIKLAVRMIHQPHLKQNEHYYKRTKIGG